MRQGGFLVLALAAPKRQPYSKPQHCIAKSHTMLCMANKEAISFRLTPEAIALIKELAKKLGVSQADIVEMAVRKLAKAEQDEK